MIQDCENSAQLKKKKKSLFMKEDLISKDAVSSVPVSDLQSAKIEDCLMILSKGNIHNPSERQILVITQSVFDPIVYSASALLQAKLMIKEIWSTKPRWNVLLPEKVQKESRSGIVN